MKKTNEEKRKFKILKKILGRIPVAQKPSTTHKDKSKYNRKQKHRKKWSEND